MKEAFTRLYATATLNERVTSYSESVSLELPQNIRDYHARIYKERDDSNYMISTFESQALIFLARTIGAKRSKSNFCYQTPLLPIVDHE
ncbi:hypothetical protein M434DRAFT_399692 [Hypoxylon sp. CO27-5]|nr:hypothetical protein M434DRAFT_399692 [Hypoxylon sp. CO27-5]